MREARMEKHTISALIVAGGAVIGGVVQGLVVIAARRKNRVERARSDDPPGVRGSRRSGDPR
jgi:hypothetical protein